MTDKRRWVWVVVSKASDYIDSVWSSEKLAKGRLALCCIPSHFTVIPYRLNPPWNGDKK